MHILSSFGTGMAVRYEPGDRVILLRDHGIGDKQISAGESGIVVRLVSSDDRRLRTHCTLRFNWIAEPSRLGLFRPKSSPNLLLRRTLQVGHRSSLHLPNRSRSRVLIK